MGPRARRRLVAASGVVLLTAAGVAGFFVTHSGSSHSVKEVYGTFGTFGVSYGSTGKQVVARVGTPDQKHGSCWIYRVRNATLGSVTLPQQVAEIDAVRYCFAEGIVSVIEDHWPSGSGWPHPWDPPVTYGCGGKKCVNTS
jgi:hypothetical protein